MSNLSTQGQAFNLRKYLSDLYELEKNKYLLEERLKQLEQQKQETTDEEYPPYVSIPFENSEFYQKYCEKDHKKYKEYLDTKITPTHSSDTSFTILFGGIGFFIGIIISVINLFSGQLNLLPIILSTIIGGVSGFIKDCILDNSDNKEFENKRNLIIESNNRIYKENKEIQVSNLRQYNYWKEQHYNDEQQKITDNNNKRNKFNLKKETQLEILSKEKELVEITIDKQKTALEKMYGLSVNNKYYLHPAYRGLSSVAVLYGYIDTGRCTELEGHEGAYNIYEQEKRMGYIIDKLDDISGKLDKMNGAMMYLGQAVYQCSDKLDQLNENSLKTLQAIEDMNFDITEGMSNLSKDVNSISGNLSNISDSLANVEVSSANSAYYAEVGSEAATFSAYYDMFKN